MAGLRERKKITVRTTIQREALRLFAEHGFDATTVDQIAEASGISPATFYRYFTSKEDSVVTDEYDPLFVQSFMERPSDEPLIDAVRTVVTDVFAHYIVRDRDLLVARHALRNETPALAVAVFEEQERTQEMFAALIARHVRRPPDDVDVRIACAAITGAMHEAIGIWLSQAAKGGEKRLREVLNHAIDRIESALRFERPS
jgi:AcrR family transcriptional regulator